MSGRKQHYIPQSLQRGFSAEQKKNEFYIWVYKKGESIYSANIKDVAAKRHFYSELPVNKERTLDDIITDYEKKLAELLRSLRNAPNNKSIDGQLAAELITHLTIRGNFVRNVFATAFQEIVSTTSVNFSDLEMVRSFLDVDSNNPSSVFTEALERELSLLGSDIPELLLKRIVLFYLREEFDTIFSSHISTIPSVLARMAGQIPDLIEDSHKSVLLKSLAPEPRVQELAGFNWSILSVSGGGLILPDCIAISIGNTGNSWLPLMLEDDFDSINNIAMPISSTQLLIGRKNDEYIVDANNFNRLAAECCSDFFLRSEYTDECVLYSRSIGNKSKKFVTSKAIESIEHAFKMKDIKDVASGENKHHKTEINFQVYFYGSYESGLAERVSSAISIIVSEFSKSMPLNHIDSIRFVSDYTEFSGSYDKELRTITEFSHEAETSCLRNAKSDFVLRNDKVMSTITMHSSLGESLLHPENETSFSSSMYILWKILCEVTYLELVDRTLPNLLIKPMAGRWDAMLFKHIYQVNALYFSSRISAPIYPEILEVYRNKAFISLEIMNEVIPKYRLSYRHTGDLDSFLNNALDLVSSVLSDIASLIGQSDGLGFSLFEEESKFEQLIIELRLKKWISLYQRDLEAMFLKKGNWLDESDFTAQNSHIERLLWIYSIFPWIMNNGDIRIEVPLEIDLKQLSTSNSL